MSMSKNSTGGVGKLDTGRGEVITYHPSFQEYPLTNFFLTKFFFELKTFAPQAFN